MEELTHFLSSCEFATPSYFWIAIPILLASIFLPFLRKNRGMNIDFGYWKKWSEFKTKRILIISIPVVIVSILLAGVLSDAQYMAINHTNIYGKPVLLLVDVSGSMLASSESQPDVSSRDLTIQAFNELIEMRDNISIGLLIYSTDNYIARYFTNRNELFIGTLENELEIARIAQGTRLAQSLKKAHTFLTGNFSEKDEKTIIVISDFNIADSMMTETIEEIENVLLEGINLYLVIASGEEHEMSAFSQLPGIKIVNINDSYGIVKMYEELHDIRTCLIREEEIILKKSLIPFLVLPALCIIGICLLISETRYRKIP